MSGTELRSTYDVVIVGAGPAGLAAGALTAGAGLSTLLVDENPEPGGQIYRAITTTPVRRSDILGADYWHGAGLVRSGHPQRRPDRHRRARLEPRPRPRGRHLAMAAVARLLQARRIILATGALERPFPIPGWTLPGVMTAGAAQTLLKSSGMLPDGQTVMAGMGPLLWLFAAQLLRAGGRIDAILDTTPRANYLNALRHAPGFALSPLLGKGPAFAAARCVRKVRSLRRCHHDCGRRGH